MPRFYEIWGREAPRDDLILLMRLMGAITSREDAEQVVEELRNAGVTDLELREVDK